jgi:spore coat protein H
MSSACGGSSVADFDKVFPQDRVNRIDIRIDPDKWDKMTNEMASIYGPFGAGKGLDDDIFWKNYWPEINWPENDPIWVPCTIIFDGNTWDRVGIRFKGSETMIMGWWMGNLKLPFKLDFGKFKEIHREAQGQRFYGFEKISFATNIFDPILLRAKIAADLFREEGVPSPHTSFYQVFMDIGEGLAYCGLYTAAEVPDRPMFITQFRKDGGNLYRPLSSAPAVLRGEMKASESFPEKSGKLGVNYSDVNEAVAALNASKSDSAVWRKNLEKKIDVDRFLKWLAIDASLENWDVSGNYYLYSDPGEGGRLGLIPWDFDGFFPQYDIKGKIDNFFGASLTLDMAGVTENPLIAYLLDDPVYHEAYLVYVRHFRDRVLSKGALKTRFQALHNIIDPYVMGDDGELVGHTYTDKTSFKSGLKTLFDYIDNRILQISAFLGD